MKGEQNPLKGLEIASLPLTLTLNLLVPILGAYYLAIYYRFPLFPWLLGGTLLGITAALHYFFTRAKKLLK